MSPEIIVPILIIVAAGVVIFFIRKWTELPAPKRPPSEPSIRLEVPPVEGKTDRILITHPLIRRAAEKALADGGKAARYITRDAEGIYFSFHSIEDPVQRAKAVEMIKGIEKGGEVNMNLTELVQLVRRLFNK
ncbi:MAG TPA: hypothetical protein VGR30_00205 [Candidatus Binatia bacterium]|jgi:hypothetical protein|nr:hypothetical protein [Candidatus Binatia bacterium]